MKKLFAATATVALLAASGVTQAFEPTNPECIAPANPGGGWDFTCRQFGKVAFELNKTPGPIQVSNKAGGGGGVAFAEVVSKRNSDNNLIVAASTATTTRLAQGLYAGFGADQVRWLGTLGADYGVIAVARNSPYKNLGELMAAVRVNPRSIGFAGGSAVGGWDHLKVLITAKAAGVPDVRQIKYIAFQGGGEAVTQLVGGHVKAFSGDISEALGFMESGDLRVLAVLAPERLPGALSDLPTAKEQGIDALGANWRGFYAPGGMSDEAYDYWSQMVQSVYASDAWNKTMTDNGLMPFGLSAAQLSELVTRQVADIKTISKDIGLIK